MTSASADHDDADYCDCRKPKPGLITQAATALAIDLGGSIMIGDRWRDIESGARAGCRTVLNRGRLRRANAAPPRFLRAVALRGAPMALISARVIKGLTFAPPHEDQDFCRRRRQAGHTTPLQRPLNPGLHHQSDTDAQGGDRPLRGLREGHTGTISPTGRSRSKCSRTNSTKWGRQALKIASWGSECFRQNPRDQLRRRTDHELVRRLAARKVQVNVTAILTLDQVRAVSAALEDHAASFISIFAGRIADTGRDPVPLMAAAVELLRSPRRQELIWASPRELLNLYHAESIGCHVITVTPDILRKLSLVDKDLASIRSRRCACSARMPSPQVSTFRERACALLSSVALGSSAATWWTISSKERTRRSWFSIVSRPVGGRILKPSCLAAGADCRG